MEVRQERRERFTTDDVDAYRRGLLASERSPRTVQKVLVLLHGVFKLAKRRKLIASNPCEDAERVSLDDPGVFNVLEPLEFEAVYRSVLGEQDGRPAVECGEDEIDRLSPAERQLYGALLSTAFYAGPRLGELRDLPWRNVDFDGAMLRIESGFTEGERTTPKGKRARSVPRCRSCRSVWRRFRHATGSPAPPATKVQAYAGHRDVKTTQRYVHHQTKAQDADLGGAYLAAALGQSSARTSETPRRSPHSAIGADDRRGIRAFAAATGRATSRAP